MASSDQTRQQLVSAALHLFGQRGYAATTTRAIAALSGTNIGLIAYHFGGKQQLRDACVETVIQRIGHATHEAAAAGIDTPAQALAALERVVEGITRYMVADPESEDVASFILRELSEGGEGLDRLYGGLIEGRHRLFCRLWGLATGQDPESEAVRLSVFAAVGQVLYFRIGRPVVSRRMGWASMGVDEASQIARVVIVNLHASIERSRK